MLTPQSFLPELLRQKTITATVDFPCNTSLITLFFTCSEGYGIIAFVSPEKSLGAY